ncbi:MAG: MarR family transcriptional regulator [Deltaproteobacteria bacterium]|nr:MarR family transcriptional regulator [Deltaproteobacteria bacterium]
MMTQIYKLPPVEEETHPSTFPLYAAARLVVQAHRPYLDALGITYPQYLIVQTLRERNGQSVTEIADGLFLDAGTVTPILKRLQSRGVILRERSKKDERTVLNYLTYEGERLALESSDVPVKAMNRGLMRQDLIEPLLNEARSLLVLLTV